MTEHTHEAAGQPGAHDPRKGHPAMGGPKTLEDGSPACKLIAWEVTRSCNLACKHCRAEAHPDPYPGELSTEEAKALIDTFLKFGPIAYAEPTNYNARANIMYSCIYAIDGILAKYQ